MRKLAELRSGTATLFMARRLLLAAALLAAPIAARAQPVAGPYVSLGAGVGLQQDEVVQSNPGIDDAGNHFLSFNPGFSGQASAGWGFGNGLRAEIEGDLLTNGVHGFGPTPVPERATGTQQMAGGMVNVLYDINLGLPVTPYIGAGIGAQIVSQYGFGHAPPGFVSPPGAIGSGNQQVGAFAYQAITGFAWTVAPGLALTAEYRFLGVDDSNAGFNRHVYADSPSGPVLVGVGKLQYANNFNSSLLLGLRYALWPPAPKPPPAPAATPAAAPAPAPARTYLVFFDWDRADLTERARQVIAEAADASTRVALTRIEVNGYTDSSGASDYNQALSLRRAQAVAAELVRDGIAQNTITVTGHGADHPLVPTEAGVREPQNRRVEIVLP
jgi:OOP family OmpA-OmpF porin